MYFICFCLKLNIIRHSKRSLINILSCAYRYNNVADLIRSHAPKLTILVLLSYSPLPKLTPTLMHLQQTTFENINHNDEYHINEACLAIWGLIESAYTEVPDESMRLYSLTK